MSTLTLLRVCRCVLLIYYSESRHDSSQVQVARPAGKRNDTVLNTEQSFSSDTLQRNINTNQ